MFRPALVLVLILACTKKESAHADDTTTIAPLNTAISDPIDASLATSPSSAGPNATIDASIADANPTIAVAAGGACPKAPPANAQSKDGAPASCTSDAECKAKPEGRCKIVYMGHGRDAPTCTYDDCQSDADCQSPMLCLCAASYTGRNVCLPSNCHSDADCKKGTTCGSVPAETNGGYIPNGRYCHTPKDQCQTAATCGTEKTCGYSTTNSRWECMPAKYPFPG